MTKQTRSVLPTVTALLVCSLVLATESHAQWTEAELATAAALRDRALSGTSAYDHVRSLTTEVGPRFAGSAGDAAAVRWALNKLGALGFTRVRTQDVLVPRWVRGETEVALLTPAGAQTLTAATLGGSVGTSSEGVEAQVVAFASLEALKAATSSAVEGKIVFVDQRTERTRDASGYDASYQTRTLGPSIAGERGALALVIRSIGTSDDRFAHAGMLDYRSDAPRIPAFAIANPDADRLAAWLRNHKSARLRVRSSARDLPPTWSANVIGEIPGRGHPEEIVLLGAHLDSWDLGDGALDDGAGIAIVVEAARLIAKLEQPPERTIRVVLFANEEFGLSGATEYARQTGDEAARHVVALEADVGQGPVWRIQSFVAPDRVSDIEPIRQLLDVERGSNDSDNGADLSPLRSLGVPTIDLSHDATDYFDVHHTANDTLAKVDAKILNRTVAAYAVAAYLAATKDGDFGRLPAPNKTDSQ